jgi:hypothetical protein
VSHQGCRIELQGVHLHLHGVSAEELAEIIRRDRT